MPWGITYVRVTRGVVKAGHCFRKRVVVDDDYSFHSGRRFRVRTYSLGNRASTGDGLRRGGSAVIATGIEKWVRGKLMLEPRN